MSNRAVATLQVVLALMAGVGSVLSWLSGRSAAAVAPVLAGEPAKTSLVYDPPLLGLAFFLAGVSGVALVLAGARVRR